MAAHEWGARATADTCLDPSSVADDAYKVGSTTTHDIDNATGQYMYGDIFLVFGSNLNLSASNSPHVRIAFIPYDPDDANFVDPGAGATTEIPAAYFVGSIAFTEITTARRGAVQGIPLPNAKFLVGIQSKLGASIPTSSTLKMRRYNDEIN